MHHCIDISLFSVWLLTSQCTYFITRNRDIERVVWGKPIILLISEFSVIFALLPWFRCSWKKCDFVSYFVDTDPIVCNCIYEYMQWVSRIDFSFNCFRDVLNVTFSTSIFIVICADYKEHTAVLVSSGILHIVYVYVCIL